MPTFPLPRPDADRPTGAVVRPFRRDDREQLTALVNAHVGAVVPGLAVSVNTVLSQLEREPAEFIVDRWVETRRTLVAEQRGRIVAAAHLVIYRDDADVDPWSRGRGELRWLICWSDAPFWVGAEAAGLLLARASVAVLRERGITRISADGGLPAPGVYGVPDVWPHVAAILVEVGFEPGDRVEHVLLRDLSGLPRLPAPHGLALRRTLGTNGTRFTALDGDGGEKMEVGFVEVEVRLTDVGRTSASGGWADVGNLEVVAGRRRTGVGRWLLGEAAHWLRLGHVDRLLHYVGAEQEDALAFARAVGFERLTTTSRPWELPTPTVRSVAR